MPPRRRTSFPRILRAALAAACLGVLGAGCGDAPSTPDGAKRLVVGFSQIGAESEWRTAATASIKAEAERRGIRLVFADAQQKQENQLKALRSFVAQEVDVVALSPVVASGFEQALKELKAAGIPVVLVDRTVDVSDPSLFATFVGADFVEEGRRAARALLEGTKNAAAIVELSGTPGAAPAIDRGRGFREVVDATPGAKITFTQTGDFSRAKGKEVMEAYLKTPDAARMNALFAHNDDMALGAIQALEEAGRRPGADVFVVSIDGVRGAFEAMAAGKLNCTVECNPLVGPQVFDAVEALAAGRSVPRRVVTEAAVHGAADAARLLPTRKY